MLEVLDNLQPDALQLPGSSGEHTGSDPMLQICPPCYATSEESKITLSYFIRTYRKIGSAQLLKIITKLTYKRMIQQGKNSEYCTQKIDPGFTQTYPGLPCTKWSLEPPYCKLATKRLQNLTQSTCLSLSENQERKHV